jgi:carboxymethylenebutenolidase
MGLLNSRPFSGSNPTTLHHTRFSHGQDVEIIKQKRGADCDIHVYAGAQHGFCCDERASFNAESAAIAWARTIRFLDQAMR